MIRFREIFKLLLFRRRWKKITPKHCELIPNDIFPINKVHVGNYNYGPLNIQYFGSEKEALYIGNFVSIASNVRFLLGGNHRSDTLTTFPIHTKCMKDQVIDAETKGPIYIKDDVWIGESALILSGVTIGQGAIIGAGSLVNKDIPPYAIAVGIPCKVIKYRFDENIIKELENIEFSKFNLQFIRQHSELFSQKVNDELIFEMKKYEIL